MQNKKTQAKQNESDLLSKEKLVVVSIGNHTRLGDVLEFAVAGTAFKTIDAKDFLGGDWTHQRLLFAVSADASGENAQLRALTAQLREGACSLEGCVCAAIADGAQGGQVHLDTVQLLLAANAAGASVIVQPLLESGRELRQFAGGKETPFARYRALARELVTRLIAAETRAPERSLYRFLTALEGGAAHDWRGYLARVVENTGGALEDIGELDETILLCENTSGLPDEKTVSLLHGSGRLRLLLASPATGSDLYTACIIERACLRGNYALPPRAVLVFDGMSAVEAMASKVEMERVKGIFVK